MSVLKAVLLHRSKVAIPPASMTLPLALQFGLKEGTGSLPAQEWYF